MTSVGAATLHHEWLRFDDVKSTSTWKQVSTDDFVLWSDLPDDEVRRGAQLLTEALRGLSAMFGTAKPQMSLPLTVVALRDGLEFERRFGKFPWGFVRVEGRRSSLFLYGPPDKWFIRTANTLEAHASVMQHELAHVVLLRYLPFQPRWFGEGMAQYLETFRWVGDATIELGDMNPAAYLKYSVSRHVSLRDLPTWITTGADDPKRTAGLYGLAWAFVHYELNVEPALFAEYLAAMANEDGGPVWTSRFEARAEALDGAIHRYLKTGQYQLRTLKVPLAPPVPATLTAAPQAEVDALLLRTELAMNPTKKP